MRFKDRIILVVGSATGMGRSTVVQLVKEGARVIAFDLLENELNSLKDELANEAGTMDLYVGDITDDEKRKGVIAFIKEKYGTLDDLLYIAGALDFMSPAHTQEDQIWDYVMDVNVSSAFRTVREALPLLIDHEGPAANIILVSSLGGFVSSSAGVAYITSKHAVLGLMKNLAYTYKFNNVRVNAINPGSFSTSIMQNAMLRWPGRSPVDPAGAPLYHKGGINTMRGDIPLGDPQYIADAICFLISDEAKYICGIALTVDGGFTNI